MQSCVAMFLQNGQGQEYIGSGGRLQGVFDQFEQVCVVMSESTYAVVCAMFLQNGQGQEYIESGGRLRGVFDQFEQVFVVMSESTYAIVCCNVFAGWAGAGVHRVTWLLVGRV